jgi:quercetin dioxygenase-like cupin family protein
MKIWKEGASPRFEPAGHFGHLTVADVVTKAESGNFAIQVSRCPPGGGGEMHWHDSDAQLFFVVEGDLEFDTGTEKTVLQAGQGILFEPGEQHATLNTGPRDSVTIVITVASPDRV